MNILIPNVICLDCKTDMIVVEGTSERICRICEKKIRIKVIEE